MTISTIATYYGCPNRVVILFKIICQFSKKKMITNKLVNAYNIKHYLRMLIFFPVYSLYLRNIKLFQQFLPQKRKRILLLLFCFLVLFYKQNQSYNFYIFKCRNDQLQTKICNTKPF